MTHAWEDSWSSVGPLRNHLSYRLIRSAGLTKNSVVDDLMERFSDGWPVEWVHRSPVLQNIAIPSRASKPDVVRWKSLNDALTPFSVKEVWRTLDGPRPNFLWCKAIWFKGCIKKFSFCSWIAFLKRHPTQDKIVNWKHNPPDFKCPLCNICADSHNHLFFECSFALDIWTGVKTDAGLEHFADSWDVIRQGVMDGSCFPKRLSQRLVFTATIYYVWQERNRRLFDTRRRTTEQIKREIREVIVNRLAWRTQSRRTISIP